MSSALLVRLSRAASKSGRSLQNRITQAASFLGWGWGCFPEPGGCWRCLQGRRVLHPHLCTQPAQKNVFAALQVSSWLGDGRWFPLPSRVSGPHPSLGGARGWQTAPGKEGAQRQPTWRGSHLWFPVPRSLGCRSCHGSPAYFRYDICSLASPWPGGRLVTTRPTSPSRTWKASRSEGCGVVGSLHPGSLGSFSTSALFITHSLGFPGTLSSPLQVELTLLPSIRVPVIVQFSNCLGEYFNRIPDYDGSVSGIFLIM